MKTETTAERDPSLTAAYFGVAASGAVLLAGAGIWFALRTMGAVGLGVVLALSNLWVVERLVHVYLRSERGRWALIALVKAMLLFALVAVLVRKGDVDVLPLAVGFGALPFGIALSGIWPIPSARKQG